MALEDKRGAWEEERRSTTYEEQCKMLAIEARTDPQLGALYSQVGLDVLNRLDKAFRAFFKCDSKYPRFKQYRSSGSFTYPQAYNGSVKLDTQGRRIFLSKVGNVRIVVHRPLTLGAKLKTCTIRREPDGKWYACLVYGDDWSVPVEDVQIPASWRAPVGIDLGLNSLITTSDGEKKEHPKFLRRAEKRLKHLQRNLSHKQKWSNNWEKARHRLAVQHSNVSNQRRDFNHKLSARLVRTHDLIVFEDLTVENIVKNYHLAKSILDAAWSQLVTFVEYKSKREGRHSTIKVSSPYTTQECYFCGTLNPVPLNVREFECIGCFRLLDRDINAARIVLVRGIAKVGQDKAPGGPQPGEENPSQIVPKLKPVEIRPPPLRSILGASPVEEAGTTRDGVRCPTGAHHWKPTTSVVRGCHLTYFSRSPTLSRSDLSKISSGRSIPTPAFGTSTMPNIFICIPQTLSMVYA